MADDLGGNVKVEPEYAQQYADLFGEDCEAKPHDANPRHVLSTSIGPNPAPQDSLTEDLASVADDLRQLYTDFGQRPYRVVSVIYAWSGGQEGIGDLSIVSEREFLPTPHVDIRGGRNEMTAAGQKLQGTAKLTQVSPQMTEDEILAFAPVAPLPQGQQSFIEIRMDERDGTQVVRRRYTVRDVPYRNATKFDWEVPLAAQQQPRNRDGELKGPMLYPDRLRPA